MNVGNVADPDVLLSGGGIQDEASLAPKLSENMLRSASNAFKHTASQLHSITATQYNIVFSILRFCNNFEILFFILEI